MRLLVLATLMIGAYASAQAPEGRPKPAGTSVGTEPAARAAESEAAEAAAKAAIGAAKAAMQNANTTASATPVAGAKGQANPSANSEAKDATKDVKRSSSGKKVVEIRSLGGSCWPLDSKDVPGPVLAVTYIPAAKGQEPQIRADMVSGPGVWKFCFFGSVNPNQKYTDCGCTLFAEPEVITWAPFGSVAWNVPKGAPSGSELYVQSSTTYFGPAPASPACQAGNVTMHLSDAFAVRLP